VGEKVLAEKKKENERQKRRKTLHISSQQMLDAKQRANVLIIKCKNIQL
jgi:hypothetical protein